MAVEGQIETYTMINQVLWTLKMYLIHFGVPSSSGVSNWGDMTRLLLYIVRGYGAAHMRPDCGRMIMEVFAWRHLISEKT